MLSAGRARIPFFSTMTLGMLVPPNRPMSGYVNSPALTKYCVTGVLQEYWLSVNAATMAYLTALTDRQATYVNSTTVTVAAYAAINPVTTLVATVNEFDVYINGQYIDKAAYTWTPSDIATQTITFNTSVLNYVIDTTDVIIINGRWQ